jgi:hypothetical protein
MATVYDKVAARKKALGDMQPLGAPPLQGAAPFMMGGSLGTPSLLPLTATQANQQQAGASIPGQAQAPSAFAQPAAPGLDIAGLYSGIGDLLKGASDAGLANTKQQLYGQIPGINQQYDDMNAQTYANARLSALGNNEGLAALGLAGNAYAAPQSGVSETSRIAQDVGLRNAINANDLARQNALQGIENQAGQAQAAARAALLGQQANLLGQQAGAQIQESQFGRSLAEQQAGREQSAGQFQQQMEYNAGQDAITNALNEAGITGTYNGQQTMQARAAALQQAMAEAGLTGMYNGQQTLEARQLAEQQQQRAIDNAMNKVNLMGVVDAESSRILGLPVGTPSWQANAWKQEFDRARRGSGSGKQPGMTDEELLKAIMAGLGGNAGGSGGAAGSGALGGVGAGLALIRPM